MQAKVSMVVPCYNKVLYIGEFFQSVYNQKWDNIELILVNDGSTDGTRDVISEWEPKLKDRGFSVLIIDQSNVGVTSAIRRGLSYVSGDYFCVPDCDDVLNPEYVSKMVSILGENSSVARVVCDCDKYSWFPDNRLGLKKSICTTLSECRVNLVNANFMGRISHSICLCLVRSIYLTQLIDFLQIDFRESQEPQSCLIFAHIGNTYYLPENLYYYRTDASTGINRSIEMDFNTLSAHLSEYFEIGKKAVMLLPLNESVRREMLSVADLGYAFCSMGYLHKYNHPEAEGIACICAAVSRISIPLKSANLNLNNGRWRAFGRSVSSYLIGYDNPFQRNPYIPSCNGRIVGYGAYGVVAKYLIPLMLDTPLKPDVLWDKAQRETEIMGIPVVKPAIESLTPDDTILVFLHSIQAVAEVQELLAVCNTSNILFYYDILDYLAEHYFPIHSD